MVTVMMMIIALTTHDGTALVLGLFATYRYTVKYIFNTSKVAPDPLLLICR
jgi:hypothetical protein